MTMLSARWWRRGYWPRETSRLSSHSSTPAFRLWCVKHNPASCKFFALETHKYALFLQFQSDTDSNMYVWYHNYYCCGIMYEQKTITLLQSYHRSRTFWYCSIPRVYLSTLTSVQRSLTIHHRLTAEKIDTELRPPLNAKSAHWRQLCADTVTQGVFNKTYYYWSKHPILIILVYEVAATSILKGSHINISVYQQVNGLRRSKIAHLS